MAAPTSTPTREERTRAAILDAAAALLPKDAGASLSEVATAAGVGRTTVHRYFPTREALLNALAKEAIDRLDSALTQARLHDGPVPAVLARVADLVIPLADEFRFLEVGPAIWDLDGLSDRWDSLARRLEALVDHGKREGTLRPDLPTAWVVDLFAGAVFTAGDAISCGRLARNDATRLVLDVLLHGAAPHPTGGPS